LNDHNCDQCDKTYKTRAGLWKHKKAKHDEETYREETVTSSGDGETSSPPPSFAHTDESPDDSPGWLDWDFGSGDESTDTIPFGFKSIVTPVPGEYGKMSKAQRAALETQNIGILKMGLSTIDVLLSKYGQAVSLDPLFEVKHSESDKSLVANAQYRYLEEKGLFLTKYLSTGVIAGSLTTWYIAAPAYRIRKNAKRKLFKGRNILSRLPLIGRIFKKKSDSYVIGQNVEEVVIE
tara:strand:- start:829 stop:1533 length:705 start_codon:yes stop_codon:yes gene_type:complete